MVQAQTAEGKKKIRLVTSRPVKQYEVEISPGETFSEMLEKIGLKVDDYMALKPSDGTEFQPSEAVWPHVGDGSKIHLTMRSDVGFFWRLWKEPEPKMPVRTYAIDLGWSSTRRIGGNAIHRGFYHAARQRWQGLAVQQGQKFEFRILKPPIGIIRGTEWEGCFHAISTDGWWHVTFKPYSEPKDLDSGIAGINKILQVCFRRAAAKVR